MPTRTIRGLLLALPLALGLMLGGCLDSPTTPSVGIVSDATLRPSASPEAAGSGSTSVSEEIDGSRGGEVKLGKWKVQVPKGAYVGLGTIQIVIDPTTQSICDLTITPESLNNFKVPVSLKYKLKSKSQIPFSQMYQWDPTRKVWRPIETSPDYTEIGVESHLRHFSRYGCQSKAGW